MGDKLFRSFNAEAGPSMFCQFKDDESFEEFYNLVTLCDDDYCDDKGCFMKFILKIRHVL